MAVKEKSIEPITEDQILSIVHKAFGNQTELRSCEQMRGGQYNTLFEIRTANPDHHAVLRVAPCDERPAGRYQRSPMLAEPIKYDRINHAGIPTSVVLAVDGSRSIIDRVCIITKYTEGVPMGDKTVPEDIRPAIRREVGRYTAMIHGLTADKFGWLQEDGSISGSESWADFFGELLLETCTLALDAEVINRSIYDEALACYAKHRPVFNEVRTPALVHNDIWDPNILVIEEDGKWPIQAIIDFDGALFADREYEFVLWDHPNPDFMEGYGRPVDPFPSAELRRKFYRLRLYMDYMWFYTVMSSNPNFVEYSKKIVAESLEDISGDK